MPSLFKAPPLRVTVPLYASQAGEREAQGGQGGYQRQLSPCYGTLTFFFWRRGGHPVVGGCLVVAETQGEVSSPHLLS